MAEKKGGKLTKAEESHIAESFDFGCEGAFKLMEDAEDRDLDTWAVASQIFYTGSFILAQHGVGLDEMIEDCKIAIKTSEEADKEAKNNDKIIESLHEQGFKPDIET